MDRLSSCLRISASTPGPFTAVRFAARRRSMADRPAVICICSRRAGSCPLRLADDRELHVTEPTLIFFPRPYRHRLLAAQDSNTQLVCATLDLDGGAGNALATALPDYLVLKLDEIPTLASTLQWLFNEAFDGTWWS